MRTVFPAALIVLAPILPAQSLSGLWSGTVAAGEVQVPFTFEISSQGDAVQATFFNGEQRFSSTSGHLDHGSLHLAWDYFAATLEATVEKGVIEGVYKRKRSAPAAFHAVRWSEPMSSANAPKIDGLWVLENVKSDKGEKAWSFIVKQSGSGATATAAILRVDGDTGTLSGVYRGGKFVLSHFSGLRPALIEATPNSDGTLTVVLDKTDTMTAYRPAVARAKGLPQPSDPSLHTGVKDPTEPLRFRFPDLHGNLVSNADPRFRGKVVLVNVLGSWCPNCHDEAPFLMEMYRKYRAEGLEIVGLDFEEADQLSNPARLKAFIARYGIDYPVLVGGTPDEAPAKLGQVTHWDAWPTTFFVGRDGRVHGVHAGFPSKASGDLYTEAKREFEAKIRELLAENTISAQR